MLRLTVSIQVIATRRFVTQPRDANKLNLLTSGYASFFLLYF